MSEPNSPAASVTEDYQLVLRVIDSRHSAAVQPGLTTEAAAAEGCDACVATLALERLVEAARA